MEKKRMKDGVFEQEKKIRFEPNENENEKEREREKEIVSLSKQERTILTKTTGINLGIYRLLILLANKTVFFPFL